MRTVGVASSITLHAGNCRFGNGVTHRGRMKSRAIDPWEDLAMRGSLLAIGPRLRARRYVNAGRLLIEGLISA
jgi:hypothetical protein